MSLSYQQKIEELREVSLLMNHFPVCDRKDRPGQAYVAKFSNGCDMGSFFSRQQKWLNEGKLRSDKEQLLRSVLKIEEKFVDNLLIAKIDEAKDICKRCGYYPVADTAQYKKSGVAKFQDQSDVGTFIEKCKMMLVTPGKLNEKERKIVSEFIEAEYSYKAYVLKKKVDVIKEVSSKLGCLPVPDHKDVDPLKVRKFQDGTDMGSFINYHNYLYRNHQMDLNEEALWSKVISLKERLRKLEFIKKMKELFEMISTTSVLPKAGSKFQDQTDVGNFISLYKRKMKQNDCTKLESWLFHKLLSLEEKTLDDAFQKKVKDSIKVIVELERFPITSGPNKNQDLVRKFDDGKDVGSFIFRNISKFYKHKLSAKKEDLVSELVQIDLEEIKVWNRGYQKAKDFLDQYGSFSTAYSNNSNNLSQINHFLMSNITLYYSKNKSLLQDIHEEMLTKLDPNWVLYMPTLKPIQKKKSF